VVARAGETALCARCYITATVRSSAVVWNFACFLGAALNAHP
jgi:hypothetical protein